LQFAIFNLPSFFRVFVILNFFFSLRLVALA
jgi:hypothetical protein